ncbi:hypothetical protein Nepgr_026913 [Nepenthes gracilis]|uniref:Cytochrome P450 724B1 n=1 Tax=Nepenthes gracilis TaxID=150966 RepID=A0AAD3T7P2_NEPGR|nr:hypothetical protein Nepgr_026913 [Nepenthes gracilis]
MAEFIPIALLMCGSVFLLLLLPLLLLSSKKKCPANAGIPTGSMGWLWFGETLDFLKPHPPNSMGTFLQQHCSRYGKVFKSHLFGSPTVVSCDHEFNLFVLRNEGKLFLGSYPKAMHGILGNFSLLIISGDLHKRLRSQVVRFASTCKSNPKYLSYIEKLSISMMESWKDRNQIFFHNEARKFLFNLTVKQVLSIEPEEPLATKILEDFLTFMKGFVSIPLSIPGTDYTKAVKARARITSILKGIMMERRSNKRVEKGDFLDMLLDSADLSDEEILSVVMDTLLGGYETTSTLLALIVYFLGQAPYVLNQLKDEHQSIRKSKGYGDPLNWEDYKKMNFTSCVVQEVLRCGNIVKFVHRRALRDVKFRGYVIPAGWKVLPVFTAAHLDPSLHQNPSQFDPWRWADVRMNKKVTPFGGGPRLCPGIELAKVETALFLHHLVLNYRWKLTEDSPLAYPYVDFQRGLPLKIAHVQS